MGNFDNIKYVGKKMAREGQCFSSTTETVKVSNDELEIIDDIKGTFCYISLNFILGYGIGFAKI